MRANLRITDLGRSRNNEHVSAHDTLNEINAAWTLASVQIASHGVFSKRRIISSLSILPKRNHHLQKLCCIALLRDLYNVENDCAIIEIIGAEQRQLRRNLQNRPYRNNFSLINCDFYPGLQPHRSRFRSTYHPPCWRVCRRKFTV